MASPLKSNAAAPAAPLSAVSTPTDEPAVEAPASGGIRQRITLGVVVVLVATGLIWAVRQWNFARSYVSTDNAQVDGHIVPVLARVGGYITAVNAAENQPVAEGSLVARIDDAEYKVRLAQAEADLAGARAAAGGNGNTGSAESAVQTASSQSAASDAQITAAQANYDKAQADLGRMKTLADKQIVSKQQLDAAQAAADAAKATLLSVQKQAAAATSGISGAEAGVRLARARLAAAQAMRDNAALQLGYTSITAPVSGAVSRKTVEVGQLVQPGQTLFSVVPDTGVWVTANYKETQLGRITVGSAARIDVDAYPGCEVEGKVESISAATGAKFALLPPDNATGNFTKVVQRVPVRIAVTKGCGPDKPLRPGMSVDAHVRSR